MRTEEDLRTYIEQGRVIQHKEANLLFWKNKDGKIEVECHNTFKATVDTYRFPNGGNLVFCNKAGEGYGQTDYNTILTTETKLADLTILDDIIGRVFITHGELRLFPFAVENDVYDTMAWWTETGESEYRRYTGAEIMELWNNRKIIGTANAQQSADEMLEFMKLKVGDI